VEKCILVSFYLHTLYRESRLQAVYKSWQCQCPRPLQNKKRIPTYVRFCCWFFHCSWL